MLLLLLLLFLSIFDLSCFQLFVVFSRRLSTFLFLFVPLVFVQHCRHLLLFRHCLHFHFHFVVLVVVVVVVVLEQHYDCHHDCHCCCYCCS